MNIKQAKKQFTELTELPAKRKSILWAIRKNKGTHSNWLSYAQGRYPNGKEFTDTRTKDCWISIVGYPSILIQLETLSFGGNQ